MLSASPLGASLPIRVAVPIKPFGVAKRRLAGVLDAAARRALGMEIATRTIGAIRDGGAEVSVVTADRGVTEWARGLGCTVIVDPERGLNVAAATAIDALGSDSRRWAIVHADLPLVRATDLTRVFIEEGTVLAPSHDGGTNVIVGSGTSFPFSYGPGSFHRHLASIPQARVVALPRIAIDLDGPRDLAHASALPHGAWLLQHRHR